MIERVITTHARTRMNHSDLLPRVHGRPEGAKLTLCNKAGTKLYDGRTFDPNGVRVCPVCAKKA